MLNNRDEVVDSLVAIFFLVLVIVVLYVIRGIDLATTLWNKIKKKLTSV